MKELISHLLRNNLPEIVSRSIFHCHIPGVHSIMLLEYPGKTIRLFITTPLHNATGTSIQDLQVAFHAHHCNLTLHCIHGEFTNWGVRSFNYTRGEIIGVYEHISKIKDPTNGGKFKHLHNARLWQGDLTKTRVVKGGTIYLEARDIHSVTVPPGEIAAWVVMEGIEDPNYEPLAWSTQNLEELDFSKLYQKPSFTAIKNILKSIDLL